MEASVSSDYLSKLSDILGTSPPALRLLLSVFAGYPFALFYRSYVYGKDAHVQHLFNFFGGLAIVYFNYGNDILHAVAAVTFTYLTLLILGGTVASVVIVFAFNMIYLLTGYYFMGTNDYDINWTMPQCVLVLRLIGLAFDYFDGNQPQESLSAENKKVALTKLPSVFETFGHAFFPASVLVGPQFPMKRYQKFVAGDFSESDKKVPPNSIEPAKNRFLLGLLYLTIFQVLGYIVNDQYILSEDYDNLGFLKKCFYLGVWGRFTLYKYISCWLLTEGACILFGLTYNDKDAKGNVLWNGCENVKIALLENSTEFNHYILSFNINTNHWVAQYIYKRLKFMGNRFISQGVALLFLAIWHGFHSGYYICFAFEFIVMYLEKDLKPMVKKNEKLSSFLDQPHVQTALQVLLRIYTFVFMGWSLLPFSLLTFERYWQVYRSVYFMGFIFFGLYPIIYGPILKIILKPKKHIRDE